MRYRYFIHFRHGVSVFANFSYGIAVPPNVPLINKASFFPLTTPPPFAKLDFSSSPYSIRGAFQYPPPPTYTHTKQSRKEKKKLHPK